MTIVYLLVALAIAFAVAAAVVGREALRLDAEPPRPVFDPDEAVEWVANHLPFEVSAELSHDDVRQILAALPAPYSDIKTGYYARLDNNSENRTLLGWLDTRNIISSWSVESPLFFTEYLRVNLYRR